MRKDKVRAYALRRQGKSYKQIKTSLGIPLGTIAGWFKNEEWSQQIRNDLGIKTSTAFPAKLAAIKKANKLRWAQKYQEYRTVAEQEFESHKNNPLFVAGLMLYWGEGNKSPKSSHVKFANNDPAMIKVFINFLTQELGVSFEKISLHLLLYPDLQDEMQKRFWSRSVGVPVSQFWKSTFITGRHSKRRFSYGVCNVWVGSRELKEKILTWLNLWQKEFA